MTFGKSIRIFLKDGSVSGMKFAEVVNHTIQAMACPRIKASELMQFPESRRPGVYFLIGNDEVTNELMVYIGEAENVFDRLQNHLTNKDFWNEVIIFISKDENLTKAHVKYLESRIIQIASNIKRYKISNSTQPQLSSLPMADRDAMEEFLQQVKLLIGIFGHKILDDLIDPSQKSRNEVKAVPNPGNPASSIIDNSPLELFLKVSTVNAKAIQTNEGIVVLAGSDATANITSSLSMGYRDLREKLIKNGQLVQDGDKYKFQEDILFSSPSAAAAIIVGYSYNGLFGWKNKDGKALKVVEEERLKMQQNNITPDSPSAF